MSNVNRKALREFLTENARNKTARELIPQAMDTLEPLFLTAESGKYGSKAKEVADDEIAKAISLALDLEVAKVIPVSLDNSLIPKLEWVEDGEFLKVFEDVFWHSVWVKFRYYIEYNPMRSLQTKLWCSLNSHLHDLIKDSLRGNLRDHPADDFTGPVGFSLLYYLSSILTGDRKTFDRLEPTIRLLPSRIPLGEKIDEPGTWFYLNFSSESE